MKTLNLWTARTRIMLAEWFNRPLPKDALAAIFPTFPQEKIDQMPHNIKCYGWSFYYDIAAAEIFAAKREWTKIVGTDYQTDAFRGDPEMDVLHEKIETHSRLLNICARVC